MFSTYLAPPEGAKALSRRFTISAHNRLNKYFLGEWGGCYGHGRRNLWLTAQVTCQLAKWIHYAITALYTKFVTVDTFIDTSLSSDRTYKKLEKLHFLWKSLILKWLVECMLLPI